VIAAVVVAGDLSDFDSAVQLQLRQNVTDATGIALSYIALVVDAASVQLTFTIDVPPGMAAADVQQSVESALGTPEQASATTGFPVTQAPQITFVDPQSGQGTDDDGGGGGGGGGGGLGVIAGAAAGGGVIILLVAVVVYKRRCSPQAASRRLLLEEASERSIVRKITQRRSRTLSTGAQLGERRQQLGGVAMHKGDGPGWATRPKGYTFSQAQEPTGLMTAAMPLSACRHSALECRHLGTGWSEGASAHSRPTGPMSGEGGGGFAMGGHGTRVSRYSSPTARHI
jgi:hypothetical protein